MPRSRRTLSCIALATVALTACAPASQTRVSPKPAPGPTVTGQPTTSVTLAGSSVGTEAAKPIVAGRRVVLGRKPLGSDAAYRALEDGLVDEINRMRRDPGAYADILTHRLAFYDGRLYRKPGDPVSLQTREGAAAVQEAISVLRLTPSLPALRRSAGMSLGARDHVRDSGPTGRIDHAGSDGSQSWDRVSRYGTWRKLVSENMSFGPNNAQDIIAELLIDDGVSDRGHRHNLLNPEIHVLGVSCGTHATYGVMCDFVQAFDFVEKSR